TVTNASYNGTIAPGQSVSVGFNGTWSGSNPVPTSFTINGSPTH
ncbi:MAG: cellulose binding domain-containing protein, partial [Ktedonobacteraceae bacterium]|nr:cellulose binding domain-containing protein [Ktedonobacteraceae bacterium]